MSRQPDLHTVQEGLKDALQKDFLDISHVIQLTAQLAKLDKDNARFSVDAGLINRLGRELVGRHETAVSELVKNAYDADATFVKLTFEETKEPGGTLIIEDDGVGMTEEQLINGFMRISTADKIHNPVSPKYHRPRAGRKGIGRFATQRLGDRLIIETCTKNSDELLRVEIDWNEFTIDREIQEIKSQIIRQPKPDSKQEGTTLTIYNLREKWTEGSINQVFRYIGALIQPFPLSKRLEKDDFDPGFTAEFFRQENGIKYQVKDANEEFFQHALAVIEGKVDAEGNGFWSVKSDKLPELSTGFGQPIGPDREDPNSPFLHLREVYFKAYYFIYGIGMIPKQTETFIRNAANEYGGIRLYRNGFRVLPYAEKGDDWLKLDESQRRNTYLFPHQNLSFFGFVEVYDPEGDIYEEKASREGIIESRAFRELQYFVFRSVIGAGLKIAEVRKRKGTTNTKDWNKKDEETQKTLERVSSDLKKSTRELEQTYKQVEKLQSEVSSQEQRKEATVALKQKVDEITDYEAKISELTKVQQAQRQELLKEMSFLRVLAGLGMTISSFVHEIKHYLPAIEIDLNYARRLAKGDPEAENRIERLARNVLAFETYTTYFDQVVSQNNNRRLEPVDVRGPIKRFIEATEPDLNRSGIIIELPNLNGQKVLSCPMHLSEWSSILFNFYSNSKKAIARAIRLGQTRQGKIKIELGKTNKHVYLTFSDNGDGIPPENRTKVFDAFFTTSSPAGPDVKDATELTGSGLGLKIVKDIVESYDGRIFVATPDEGYSTTLKVEVPFMR